MKKLYSSSSSIMYPILSLLLLASNAVMGFVPPTCPSSRMTVGDDDAYSSLLLRLSSITSSSSSVEKTNQRPLNVAVVGAGPSGLLLSHLLLKRDPINTKVTLVEARPDPRALDAEQRAYALGLGIRGRTAIRRVDEALWQSVRQRGYECERFQLHVAGFVIPLRTEQDGGDLVEPSLLTFQSDLCAALLDELERRHGNDINNNNNDRLKLYFDTKVTNCNLDDMVISVVDDGGKPKMLGMFDLVVGCDGVNSVVREVMEKDFASFQSTKEKLPDEYKVVRWDMVPSGVDPTAVSLIIPKKGSTAAFVEPTGKDGSCCILFSGRQKDDPILSETKNKTAVVEALQGAFPKWEDTIYAKIADELMAESVTGKAFSVVCNTYHCSDKAVLVGDAAHATGGSSGQGVNSALMDSVVLEEAIKSNRGNLGQALMAYSQRQVAEGKALYDLSFGPKPRGIKAFEWAFRNARDAIFRGRWGIGEKPLQTRLTTDLTSFTEIRRERGEFYDEPFPTDEQFQKNLTKLQAANVVKGPVDHSIVHM